MPHKICRRPEFLRTHSATCERVRLFALTGIFGLIVCSRAGGGSSYVRLHIAGRRRLSVRNTPRSSVVPLHGGVAHIAELRFPAGGLAVKPAVGIGRARMHVILALLAVEVGPATTVSL